MAKVPSLMDLRERLKLEQAITAQLKEQLRLKSLLAAPSPSSRTRPKSKRSAVPSTTRTMPTRSRPKTSPTIRTKRSAPKTVTRTRRRSQKAKFKALHPQDPKTGRFLSTRHPKSPETGRFIPVDKYRMTLRPVGRFPQGPGKGSFASYIVVLIVDRKPSEIPPTELGELISQIRTELQEDDPRVKWVANFNEWGPWYGPDQPGEWWTETVRRS